MWRCASDDLLQGIFEAQENKSTQASANLIAWCLQGNPADRPSFQEILHHPFLTKSDSELLNTSEYKRYHLFLSHMQAEASGAVSTIHLQLQRQGVRSWLDMYQSDLTERGMQQGVYSSDVFVMFLTTSVLTRPFCLKEISWALSKNKHIIIVRETDPRFAVWDFQKWRDKKSWDILSSSWIDDANRQFERLGSLPSTAGIRDEIV